jgi:hypothetical protein
MLLGLSIPVVCTVGALAGMQTLVEVLCFFPQSIALALAVGFVFQTRKVHVREDATSSESMDDKRWNEMEEALEGREADTYPGSRNVNCEVTVGGRPASYSWQVWPSTHGRRTPNGFES